MNQNKIYVGNLSYDTSEDGLRQEFSSFGEITDLIIIKDRATGRSKGFGFITFESGDSADTAVNEMNGKQIDGRALKVSIAQEKQRSGGAAGGGGGRGGRW